ncbi:hydrolase [Planosporangium flavigriseum]|uniref:Hydrolase n=1 Tax=Planosporangium flavigriseum TaxID=373681 RepID=A0A8J3PNN3_9ACTN|nr:hydrolase [Planosporangium flavigriseum]NJC64652.1 hydrolase [Planosporangium flavigriseum]GIG74126.1 hydrolase [Planosporangium flavigriseum]
MVSLPIRDPVKDHLLTPKNAALVIIDYQPLQMYTVHSTEPGRMINNMIALTRLAKVFGVPIILSTVNVTNGVNPDTIKQLKDEIPNVRSYDRTQINAWEDREFVEAVKGTGRRKLIMCALWTEACLLFPTLDALNEGYDVWPVTDAVGGTTVESHRTALQTMNQAGAKLTTWNSVACMLQRDWARKETVPGFLQTVIDQNLDWGWYEELRGAGKRQEAPVPVGAR